MRKSWLATVDERKRKSDLVFKRHDKEIVAAVIDGGALNQGHIFAPAPVLHQVWHSRLEIRLNRENKRRRKGKRLLVKTERRLH